MTETPWFWASTPPTRPGVYRVELKGFRAVALFSYWTGDEWRHTSSSASGAYAIRAWRTFSIIRRWRGVTEPQP